MNRSTYFNYITDQLGTLAFKITIKGKLNVLDYHNHSEDFFLHLLNMIYGWELENENESQQNIEAIDLIDHKNKIVVQISATNTKTKVESSLDKDLIKKYPTYQFKFVSIAKDASELRGKSYSNPHKIGFNPVDDIIDQTSLLAFVKGTHIDRQKDIYSLVKKELGNEIDIVKLDSNISSIINLLAKEDHVLPSEININTFEIARKISHNNLVATKQIVENYALYHSKVDKQYTEFDALGVNKSLSVLNSLNKSYIQVTVDNPTASEDEIFLKVIDHVTEKILNSANFLEIPIDELDVCVNILVVDAFIRCKVFKNPEAYNYATT